MHHHLKLYIGIAVVIVVVVVGLIAYQRQRAAKK
jgi:FtsH-binding integral membrane protein